MFNTGNPPGSFDPRDLFDNSVALDNFLNNPEETWPDRFGVPRLTLPEIARRADAAAAIVNQKLDRVTTLDKPSGQDDTQVLQNAISDLQVKGGGILMIIGVWRYSSLATDGTVSIYGIGPTRSVLIHRPASPSVDGLVFQPTQSFLRPALNHFAHLCEGEGRYGISTPVDGGQFTRAFAIDFAGMSIRRSTGTSAGWSAALRIGDTVASSFKASEIRMGFDVSLDPAGQKDTVGVLLEAATANVAADLTGLQIVGCKYPVRIGENVEGYFLTNTELVNGLDGVSSVNTVSKPGGFHGNLHINCARYPIALQNRRDFNINGIQLYRGSGHFNGTTAWVGFKLDNCSRFNIDGQNFRVVSGYSSKSHAFQINGSTDIGLGSGVLGEDGAITDGFTLTNCKAFFIDTQKMATGMATWLTLTSCSFGDVGKLISQDGTVPAAAYSIDATNAKRNIKVDRTDLDRLGYDEITYTAAATKVIPFTEGNPVRTFNLNAGTAAYTVDIQILRANHLPGMTYKFRVVMGASTNPTIRFLDDTTANVRRTIVGTTTQTIYEIELVFNNAGWVISRFVTSAA